jgi:hypothetical protein
MATVANLQVQIGATIKGLEGSLKKAESSLNAFAKNATAIGGTLSKALTAPLVGFATASVFAFDKQAKAVAQVEQAIASTGGAAGKTSKELQKMASALQDNSLFGDEEILQKVTAQLLTFTNISGRAFDRTQQAALDLATRLGGDLQSASIQLGKALNDPVSNLSALSRAGIQFSEDQKALIDTLVATGRLAEAQTVILDELEKQYGGSAQAAAKAGAGGITQLKNSFGDLMEVIGEVVVEAINPFVDRLKEIVKQLQATDKETLKYYVTIGALVAAIGPALIALGAMAKGLTAVNALLLFTLKNPYVLVATGVVALTGYFATLYLKAKRVNDLLKEPFDATLPIDEQLQNAIKRVDALDKRVAGMRKNLGIGVTTESGLEAQQRQLTVAENRLSVERQMLIELIAQKKATDEATESNRANVQVTQSHITALQSISAELEKNQAKIDAILDINGQITDAQYKELATLLGINKSLENQVKLRESIANQIMRGQDPDLSRNVQRMELPDSGPLQQQMVDSERYANSMGVLGSKIKQVSVDTKELSNVGEQTSASFELLSGIANNFTASFGAGMANVIVQGEKLQDVLKNIGKLLLSSAIQKGISLLLTGGLASAGTGFFGSGGGLFGKLMGGTTKVNDAMITSTGRVIEFSPKDNILAMQDLSQMGGGGGGMVRIQLVPTPVRISNKEIVFSFTQGQTDWNR